MSRTPETCAAKAVTDLADAADRGHSTVKRHIKTLVEDAGWKRRSKSNVKLIHAALTDAGVYTDEDITDLRLSPKTWVKLGREPFPEKRTGPEFAWEKDLNAFLQYWHHEAFSGIPGLEGIQFVKAQRRVEYDGKVLKIDLVFDDGGTTVVVELKTGEPPKGTVRQLRDYLRACQDKGIDPVRGFLISGIPATEQAQADILTELDELRADYEVAWYQYRLGVTLERID